jgi:hypothetical protein
MQKRIATFLLLVSATIIWQPIANATPQCADQMNAMATKMAAHDHSAMQSKSAVQKTSNLDCECAQCGCDIGYTQTALSPVSTSILPAQNLRALFPKMLSSSLTIGVTPLLFRPPIA